VLSIIVSLPSKGFSLKGKSGAANTQNRKKRGGGGKTTRKIQKSDRLKKQIRAGYKFKNKPHNESPKERQNPDIHHTSKSQAGGAPLGPRGIARRRTSPTNSPSDYFSRGGMGGGGLFPQPETDLRRSLKENKERHCASVGNSPHRGGTTTHTLQEPNRGKGIPVMARVSGGL